MFTSCRVPTIVLAVSVAAGEAMVTGESGTAGQAGPATEGRAAPPTGEREAGTSGETASDGEVVLTGPLSYGESFYSRFHYGWSQLVSLETERWRYIEAPTPELYDLHEDPDELDNLHDRRPAVAGAQRLESEGRLAEARTLLQELAREDPANPDVHFALASVHFKSQDWHEAIDVNRGNILLETGRLEEARQAFLAAQTAAAQGRLEVARRWAREAAERSPDDPRVRQLLERLGVGGRRAADGPTGRGGGRPDR